MINLIIGFVLGALYMNGTLAEFGDIMLNLVNSTAEQVSAATEPTTLEKLEQKMVDLTD